jgi:glutaminyl-peptide cyclotransferase
MKIKSLIYVGLLLFYVSCSEDTEVKKGEATPIVIPKSQLELVKTPIFNKDSAYYFIEKQVSFGPRVPNSASHEKCATYLVKTLYRFGLDTMIQRATVKAYNGKELKIKNIIGRYKPENLNRLLLFAHWDTRPYADRGTDKRNKPIDGANDGASGVGVWLEVARAISLAENNPNIGFDIVFFDAEDYGQPQETMNQEMGNTWCLGSQYFAKNIPFLNYRPKYGILLDMVGAENAVFPKEGYSMYFAADQTNHIWNVARKLGYDNYFIQREMRGGITDDHRYINEIAKIPSVDILHYELGRNDFGSFHHTHNDNMSIIHKETLEAVGNTMLQVIYLEQ